MRDLPVESEPVGGDVFLAVLGGDARVGQFKDGGEACFLRGKVEVAQRDFLYYTAASCCGIFLLQLQNYHSSICK